MTSSYWPLGPLLETYRQRAGFTKREAARRADISEGMWRKLENGYFTVRAGDRYELDASDPTRRGTTPDTVARVAQVVKLDVDEALVAAGFEPLAVSDASGEASDVDGEAYEQFEALYKTFEKAWGPDVARAAMREAYRRRHTAPTETPDRPSGSADGAAG